MPAAPGAGRQSDTLAREGIAIDTSPLADRVGAATRGREGWAMRLQGNGWPMVLWKGGRSTHRSGIMAQPPQAF